MSAPHRSCGPSSPPAATTPHHELDVHERLRALEAQVDTLTRVAALEAQVAALQRQQQQRWPCTPPPSPPEDEGTSDGDSDRDEHSALQAAVRASRRSKQLQDRNWQDPLEAVEESDWEGSGRASADPPPKPSLNTLHPGPARKLPANGNGDGDTVGELGAAATSRRKRAISARPQPTAAPPPRVSMRFMARCSSFDEGPSAPPLAAGRARGHTNARSRARAETEARVREVHAYKAKHAEILAKREVEAVKQSFEEDRQGRRCPVINPYDSGIRWWEIVITSVLCYQAVEMPLRLAFELLLYSPTTLLTARAVELCVDALFLTDLILNFFISYLDDDMQVVTDHVRIAQKYLGGFFLIDLLGGFPFDACFPVYWEALTQLRPEAYKAPALGDVTDGDMEAVTGSVNLVKGFKLGRLFKMVKIAKLGFRIIRLTRRSRAKTVFLANATSCTEILILYLTQWIHPFAYSVMKHLIIFLYLVHVFACLQFTFSDAASLVPACAGDEDGAHQCWLYRANVLPVVILPNHTIDGGALYAAAFFHTGQQMLNGEVGLGGDPEFTHEYALVFVSSLIGFFWQALIVASITTFLDHVGKSGKQYRENVDRLRQYVKRHRLPFELRERLLLYYQVRYPDGRFFDDNSVINDLSRPLQLEIREHQCAGVLDHLHLKRGSRLSHALASALELRVFVAGARVIQQGDAARAMYFVLSGTAEVQIEQTEHGLPPITLPEKITDGHIFGHDQLLRKHRSDAPAEHSVVVVDLMEAFELLSESFDAICAAEPTFKTLLDLGAVTTMDASKVGSANTESVRRMLKMIGGRTEKDLRATSATRSSDGSAEGADESRKWSKVRHVNTAVLNLCASLKDKGTSGGEGGGGGGADAGGGSSDDGGSSSPTSPPGGGRGGNGGGGSVFGRPKRLSPKAQKKPPAAAFETTTTTYSSEGGQQLSGRF